MSLQQWNHKIFNSSASDFAALALEMFYLQHDQNPIYRSYCDLLKINRSEVNSLGKIPFLPIQFFKSTPVKTGKFDTPFIFESSGTTGSVNSRHEVKDIELYKQSFVNGFERQYGPIQNWCIIGLLPSYLERNNSSLVFMVNELIQLSNNPDSGFYLNEFVKLEATLQALERRAQSTMLIGVTFALLDFAAAHPMPLQHTRIMETGGMKGRRKDMVRAEVQEILKKAFQLATIDSEYGMTELLSQAYSKADGIFNCPPWMRVMLRDEEDPLLVKSGANMPITGAINIIDLANIHSCGFIATDDIGRLYPDGSFEVLGRMDNSELRGCSLLTV